MEKVKAAPPSGPRVGEAVYVVVEDNGFHSEFVEIETADGKSVSVASEAYPSNNYFRRIGPLYRSVPGAEVGELDLSKAMCANDEFRGAVKDWDWETAADIAARVAVWMMGRGK